MNVSLPMTLEDFVRRKVAAGEFESADEVVCEALHLLQDQEAWRADARRKIDEGWEQAKAGQLSTPEEVRQFLAARQEFGRRRMVHQGLPPHAEGAGRPFH
jgi:putative addiction module CopG family antidote